VLRLSVYGEVGNPDWEESKKKKRNKREKK